MSDFRINPLNLNFDLPAERIAQVPLKIRDQAKLMVLHRETGAIEHKTFSDLKTLLRAGDMLVLNQAKVDRVKLLGRKPTGGKVELIILGPMPVGQWRALVRPELKVGQRILVGEENVFVLAGRTENGENILRLDRGDLQSILSERGRLPLPPYIRRQENDSRTHEDETDYQTVYASHGGSLAAPTAGLHFTPDLLTDLSARGVHIHRILLNVGWGTFRPISKSLDQHEMLPERYEVGEDTLEALIQAKKEDRRILAVGTTVTRVLESLSPETASPLLKGETNLFIRPGFQFHWISGLITNFHTPRSTPISLTAAFAGFKFLEKAYEAALMENYRFFSYGDAMMVL